MPLLKLVTLVGMVLLSAFLMAKILELTGRARFSRPTQVRLGIAVGLYVIFAMNMVGAGGRYEDLLLANVIACFAGLFVVPMIMMLLERLESCFKR